MKANELMIGDWVYDIILKAHTKVEILSVSGIRGDFHESVYNEKTFEPIPLTAEILEKNLATEPQIAWCVGWNKKDDIHVEINREDLNASFYGVIDFVHQLQHALRLCGINKEIEL